MGAPQKMIIDGKGYMLVPEDEYEDMLDVARAHAIKARGEESFPVDVVKALLDGENPVRVYRKHRGMSGKQLADATGLSPSAISDLETGKREGTAPTLRRVADALGVTIDDIV